MALVIGVADPRWPGHMLAEEPSVWLEDGGIYWWLHPLIERLADRTGHYMDLYDSAVFRSEEDLAALGEFLDEVMRRVAEAPEEWDVHVGTQQTPERREIFETVRRAVVLELLHQWRTVLRRAYDLQLPVACSVD